MATSTTTTAITQTTSQAKPRVRRGSRPFIFHIESRTRPGRYYVTDAHRLTCTCEAGQRDRGCWHLRLALGLYDWFKRQQQPTPQTPAGPAAPKQTTMQPVALSSYFE